MIPCSQPNVHSDLCNKSEKLKPQPLADKQIYWQQAMKTAIRSPCALIEKLGLSESLSINAIAASDLFRVFVPLSFLERMEKGNPDDPLLRQVLPVFDETLIAPGFSLDPLGEKPANPVKGLVHKYKGRLLVFPSTQCAVNCRYCFRRHFPYDDNRPNKQEWEDVLGYIRAHTDIKEVIYSGGDPLTVNDKRLAWLTGQITEITHVERLRIHTRLPIVIPQRVNNELLSWLEHTRLKTVLVVHCNHANEINQPVIDGFLRLREAGVTLFNQSVLLKGVNNSVPVLRALNEKLFDHGVIPYYLHLLDRVQGTAHFEVSDTRARQLMAQLSAECPGYLVPRLVREEAGKKSKTVIPPDYCNAFD